VTIYGGERTRASVMALAADGACQSDIAREVGVSRQRVHQILRGYSTLNCRGLAETVHEAQGGHCAACRRLTPLRRGHVHHLTALAKGGTHEPSNLVFVCHRCHRLIHRGRKAVSGWLLSPLVSEWRFPEPPEPRPGEHRCRARNLEHLRTLYLAVHPRANSFRELDDEPARAPAEVA